MKTINVEEMQEILNKHLMWRRGEEGGECAYLTDANLRGANLRGADLTGADLTGADLIGADLRGAYLRGAYLRGANLTGADLRGANLRGANLTDADLTDANLRGADLTGADLRGANLRGADLTGADLTGAYLRGVRSFNGASGNGQEVKAVQCGTWPVTYTVDQMQIGCQLHPLSQWWVFTDAEISSMDSKALDLWRVWKPILKQIIEASPALPHAGTKSE
jgi:uncharacterized protein YjbI with pentapeptide repeats